MKKLAIDIWSDIACPWCHVGKRRIEAALARFPHASTVTWRAFELDPNAPKTREPEPYARRIARKYGSSEAQAQAQVDRMTAVAKADGLDFHFDRVRPGNTFDAHRLLHLAHEHGKQDALKERLFVGYLSEGEAIGDREAIGRLAVSVGLDADEVKSVLSTDRFAAEVRAEEHEAKELGITGVPFFVIGRYAVSGAQPAELLLEVIEKAWREENDAPVLAEGAVCGPDGCA